MELNAHEKPPSTLRAIFKKYQKISHLDLSKDKDVINTDQIVDEAHALKMRRVKWIPRCEMICAFHSFKPASNCSRHNSDLSSKDVFAFEPMTMPGLYILPSLIPLDIQKDILSRLLHRDLQNPNHKTNAHLHHDITYPLNGKSFFTFDPSTNDKVQPKDATIHKPMTVGQLMHKKLRWMTLGGQYDWTNKVYPDEKAPLFPEDLSTLLHRLFPQTKAEAAIVNLYSPGDTLSLHRDVSEYCDRGLISLSIGCDAIFVLGLDAANEEEEAKHLVLRISSGAVIYMTGSVRHAWHGVASVIPNTCPQQLVDWPSLPEASSLNFEENYQNWRGWMASKRINLNVRQMKPE